MMKITNKYTATVILPPNEPVHRGQSINYLNWDAIKDMPNIAWYVDNRFLLVEDAEYVDGAQFDEFATGEGAEAALAEMEASDQEEDSEEDTESEPDEKTKLIADLAELGVEVDGRTGLKKLRAMLDEKLAEQQ